MPTIPFYICTAIMLGFGLLVILNRNPVASALSLVVSFLGLAGLFISLNAYFIGVIQILVYAGAIMVLFLFIIMLLDLKAEATKKINYVAFVSGVVLSVLFVLQLMHVVGEFPQGQTRQSDVPIDYKGALAARVALAETSPAKVPATSINAALAEKSLPDVKLVGEKIFTEYNFHLQIVGVLLLVATIGVVVLSKRELE